jgi:uncharacterized membrane protein YkvA (DUF1232 family)
MPDLASNSPAAAAAKAYSSRRPLFDPQKTQTRFNSTASQNHAAGRGATGNPCFTEALWHSRAMSQLAEFVRNGAGKITPQILRGVHKKLPALKIKFAQISTPRYPHLPAQLNFLSDVVEDFVEGQADTVPYCTITYAAFALIYAHRENDIIPDSVPEFGMSDDSGVARVVLIEHEKVLADYAKKLGRNWADITTEP